MTDLAWGYSQSLGLALSPAFAQDGAELAIRVGTADVRATVKLTAFYDPEGKRLRA